MNISPVSHTRPEPLYAFADVGVDMGTWLDGDQLVGDAAGYATQSQAVESAKLLSTGAAPAIVIVAGEDQRFHLQSVIWQHEHDLGEGPVETEPTHPCDGDYHVGMFAGDAPWPPARPSTPVAEPEYLSFTDERALAVVDDNHVIEWE